MLTLIELSHHTAPITLREQVAFGEKQLFTTLGALREQIGPGVIVSTCNRTELYVSGEHDKQVLLRFLAERSGVETGFLEKHTTKLRNAEAVHHLYAVASGLESIVIGESEILGQVRSSFSTAVTAGSEDSLLSKLFHTAIRTGRRARNETHIGAHALSISTIAAQQAHALIPEPGHATVLVIGTGKIGGQVAEALVERGMGTLLVTNRTYEHAQSLAEALDGEAIDFEQLSQTLARANVVITAASFTKTLVTRRQIEAAIAQREGAPLVILDISMPRNVDPAVRTLPNVQYLDLDDLQGIAARNRGARVAEITAVGTIINAEVVRFMKWWDQLKVAETIAELTTHAERLRGQEVERTTRRMGASKEQREHLDAMTRTLMARLLHNPITTLRERGDRDVYVEALRALFHLDESGGRHEDV